MFYIVIWYLVNSKSLGLEINIEVSNLSIYREEDIKYITPKMIIFSVFFIIKHLFLCVKQTHLRDVSFTHQNHMFLLTVTKIVHIKYYWPYFLFQRTSSISKNQISYFRGFKVYVKYKLVIIFYETTRPRIFIFGM